MVYQFSFPFFMTLGFNPFLFMVVEASKWTTTLFVNVCVVGGGGGGGMAYTSLCGGKVKLGHTDVMHPLI